MRFIFFFFLLTAGECFEPKDIVVGQTYLFQKRPMIVFDASEDTYQWYEKEHGINMRVNKMDKDQLVPPPEPLPRSAPPPNSLGIGSEEDTLQAWKSLRPKAIKKDEARLVQYEGKILRFAAKFTTHKYKADEQRQFIVSYFLSDGTIKVFEPIKPNSGIQGGKYLERRIMRNPATGFYFNENDFEVGKKITIASTEFELLGCDNFTKKYLSGDMVLHEMKGIDEVEHLLRAKVRQKLCILVLLLISSINSILILLVVLSCLVFLLTFFLLPSSFYFLYNRIYYDHLRSLQTLLTFVNHFEKLIKILVVLLHTMNLALCC